MSCGDNEEKDSMSLPDDNFSKDKEAVFAFSCREDILSAVNSEPGAMTRADIVSGDVKEIQEQKRLKGTTVLLLTDLVLPDDPILDEVSEEEKNVIIEEGLTYYDLQGCEDYIPSESFAKILNSKCEIQLEDSLYKITEFGVLRTLGANGEKLDSAYGVLKADTTIAMK